ncbi:hypothetical protein Asulf_01215 [Archaeoglobus sulfaticallidus PM70-1]|uniref:Uncharacterized protein n=1 Tax=Archaeoglobus sulfaticallidus PM70-1 TaxID=387631 RepID=N0BDX7_9EURY|nr:hypothetical protein [Archaeoglobus sulfaticallidus]AGK61213.1 hypothetical protein Asulf_01215 [Archaeoglobus sulfaticallidus PM70-1]
MDFNFFYIPFILVTFAVILIVERITARVVSIIFRKDLEEMEEQQRKIAEYHELSLLALASRDRLAYEGFREMMNELYWKVFFRQLIIASTVFFIILSPYMFLSEFLLKEYITSPFSMVFATAIFYFMMKNVYGYFKDLVELRREVKKAQLR